MPAVERDALIGLHPAVAEICGIERSVFQKGAAHVFLDPAQEIDAGLAAAALPEGQVDPAFVVDQQDALPIGRLVLEAPGRHPLQRGGVMLVEAFPGGQMAPEVGAQVQTVEMADGHLLALVPQVMRARPMPVSVQGEAPVARQFGQIRQAVGNRVRGDSHLPLHFRQQGQAARAGQGLKVGGMGRLLGQAQGAALLEESPSAGAGLQEALKAHPQPAGIGNPGAIAGVGGGGGEAVQRLKKSIGHGAVVFRDSH